MSDESKWKKRLIWISLILVVILIVLPLGLLATGYIYQTIASKSDWERAQPEVREYEPLDSLVGGDDGMDFYRMVIHEAPSLLCKGGWLLLEVGIGQADMVSDMIKKSATYSKVEVVKDLSQIKRVVKAQR